MSETPSAPIPAPTPTPPIPAPTPTPVATTPPATIPATDPAPKPSIVSAAAVPEWKEYAPDATKTAEENTALKAAHDATKPTTAPAVVPAASVLTAIDFAKDIKLPEGFVVDKPTSDEFTNIVNDHTLTRPQMAQKLVDLQTKALTSLSEKGKADWETLQEDWRTKTHADPVVGGNNFAAVEANISRLLTTFGDTELRSVFDLTGAGNHPRMVKFLNAIAVKLNEPLPSPPADPSGGVKDPAAAMFPTMKK